MALIDCVSCGHQISAKAPKCPQCGDPSPRGKKVSTASTLRTGGGLVFIFGGFFGGPHGMIPMTILGFIIFMAGVVMGMSGGKNNNKKKPMRAAVKSGTAKAPTKKLNGTKKLS